MKETVIELVDVILRRMAEHPEVPHTEHGIRSWLTQQGYSKRDIETALRLVGPRFLRTTGAVSSTPASVRPLSESEQFKLTAQARDAFARLEVYGLISPYERELILDRLGHFEGQVGLEELDYLVSWVLSGTRDYESQHTLYNVIEGQRDSFH